MKLSLFAPFAALLMALAAPAYAAGEKPLFASSDKIHIVIQAPLGGFIRNRATEDKIAGTLVDPSGQSLPIALQLRGITRRTSDVCDFPPLRVEFTAPPPPTSIFAGQKKLKLITHCRNSPGFQQYVLLEYAAYGMYNLLTPHSFRARLADIDYRDETGRPIVSRIGFFLEELGDLAHRNGMRSTHAPDRIALADLSPSDAARYALFEDMIGNHDWSMRAGPVGKDCCHNAELIGPLAPGQTIPVPYDFDFSGYVDTPYATPPAELDIASVKDRLYRGYCVHNAEAVAVAHQMNAARPRILAVLTQVPGLDPRTQARAASYLNGFFTDISSDATLGSKVLRSCVG
ncbi:MAG: hypothetical protein ACTHOI_11100 [Sphingomicrobium sp.]